MPPPPVPNLSPIQAELPQQDFSSFLIENRFNLMAQACADHPELQFGDDIVEIQKEAVRLDKNTSKLLGDIRYQQGFENEYLAAKDFRGLRDAQIKKKRLLCLLKITIDQKREVNDRIEKFVDDFHRNMDLIFGPHKEEEEPTILKTPETIQHKIEILERQKEFVAEEWKIEQVYVQANAEKGKVSIEYEAEYDLPAPLPSGRGRRPQAPTVKSLNRSLASPRRAKKPDTPVAASSSGVTSKPKQKASAASKEKEKEVIVTEEEQAPPEKKKKSNIPAASPTTIASPSNTKEVPKKRKIIPRKSTEAAAAAPSKPSQPKTPSTPEEIAAKKEERAKVKKAKEEEQRKQQTEAEEIALLTAQLELEGDIPRRRAAATAAANAIHSAHIHQPKAIATPKTSITKEPSLPATSSAAAQVGGKKRSSISKKTRKSTQKGESEEETYCICKEISYGDMIACDNEQCKILWFHFGCVGLKIKPKRGLNWYCQDCRGEKSSIIKKK